MKKLLTFALVAFGAISLSAATVNLDWDDNPAPEGITQYVVYEDNGDGTFSVKTSSTTSNAAVLNVTAGVHKYVVAAVNVWGEGPKSGSVTTPLAPSAPTGLTITVISS
jgi:hypothetical protein